MPNYQNGKIYKIIDSENQIIYIGSTTQKLLCSRFSTHTHRGKGNKIILLELCPCNSREELVKKEQDYIDSQEDLLNQMRAYRTEEYTKEYDKNRLKLYRENNKKHMDEYGKLYRENNKKQILEKGKQYRENTKEQRKITYKKYYENNVNKILEYHKDYRLNNKHKISEKAKVKITCECGCQLRKDTIVRHRKTKKHIDFITNK